MEKIVAGDLSCEWFGYISPRSFNWKEKNWTGSRLNRWEGPMKTQEFDLYSLPRFVLWTVIGRGRKKEKFCFLSLLLRNERGEGRKSYGMVGSLWTGIWTDWSAKNNFLSPSIETFCVSVLLCRPKWNNDDMLENIICIDEFCIKSVLQPLKSRVELKIYIKMINFYLLENDTRYEEQYKYR